ncbi:MAG: hypothetical protein LBS89_06300, partial [Zoogloeaceae bacterium]|nr:hypothetical protein [Zoogloeaceae bacterium]
NGHVEAVLPPFATGALRAQVQGYEGLTPYVKWGDGLIFYLVLIIILFAGQNPRVSAFYSHSHK